MSAWHAAPKGARRLACVFGSFLFFCTTPPVSAQTETWTIHDSGFERTFVLALDEIAVRGTAGVFAVRSIAITRSPSDLRVRAAAMQRAIGAETQLVLYESDMPRNEYTRRITTELVLTLLEPEANPQTLAAETGGEYIGPSVHLEHGHLFRAQGPGAALDLAAALRQKRGVVSAEPLLAKQQRKRAAPTEEDSPTQPEQAPRPLDFKSIHQIEMERHRDLLRWPEDQIPTEEIPAETPPPETRAVPRLPTAGVLTHKVLGWYPSWNGTKYTNLNYAALSTIGYFSYEVNATNGSYNSIGYWNTTPLLLWAASNNVRVVLTATLFGNTQVKMFLTNATARQNFINTIVALVSNRNAHGVCVDFESISDSSLKAPLTGFLSNLAVRFHRDLPGSEVSVALPAVDWSSVFDVAALSQFLDYAVIMAYDYYWSTAPNAGPVSPLKASTLFGAWCVERSIDDYLAKGIPAAKLLAGFPLYGYEWPTVSTALKAATTGSGTARTYPTAVSRAATYGRRWDTNSFTPYFVTGTTGNYTQCWYDDTNSLKMKFDLAKSKGLGGIGLWALGYEDSGGAIWGILQQSFTTTNIGYPNDPLFPEQWHLKNTGQNGGTPGIDVNVTGVWSNYRGSGLMIGIVDDGLQTGHTDLWQNVNTSIDIDFNGGDKDPNPDVTQDFHGTACAGVAAARGNNGRGVCGAAPEATLVGIRLIGGPATDQDEADALSHSNQLIFISSNSWGPNDDGKTLAGPGALTQAALRNMCANGRSGKGTIFAWAAGNGADYGDNANKDGYANSIYTIAIGAVSDQGTKASYSEPGACVVVCAPSSSFDPDRQGITTTDLMGNNGYNYAGAAGELADVNYTKTFGGTSSATPLAAGVMALILQAAPNLGWRDMQEILIRTAKKNAASDPDWITNGGGFHFNHKYGAGLLDAAAAVALATTWSNLGPQISIASVQTNLALSIPDNNATGVTRTFAFSNVSLRVEHATLTVDISHANRGDLEVVLVSPFGTTSRLMEVHGDTGDHYRNWTFSSVRHWGEQANGTWTVRVADRRSGTSGTLNYLKLELFGTTGANVPPIINPIGDKTVTLSNALSFVVTASDPNGDPITLTASNRPAGSTFTASGGTGTFSWASAAPAGVYTTKFYATDGRGGAAIATVLMTVTSPPPVAVAANVWINEIHYDNASTDIGEGIEIAGPAGVVLTNYSLVFYNGGDGAPYKTVALSGSIDNESCGHGAVWFAVPDIQNGAPDGVALVFGGSQILQFLSYEGSFTASSGPAAGRTAQDIAVLEKGTEPAGQSLQLKGYGSNYAQFAWSSPTAASPGSLNTGQSIAPCSAGTPPQLPAIPPQSVVVSNHLQFTVTAVVTDGDPVTLSASNRPSGSTFSSTGAVGTFIWTNARPVGVYTMLVYAADKDGAVWQPAVISVTAPSTGATAMLWINELHYDNNGTDTNEGAEVAGIAGTALTNYSLVFYNGGDGAVYKTVALSGVVDDEGCGYGAVWVAASGLQNGAPDGVALVYRGTQVVQFLSYEGTFTAGNAGAAAGQTSTDIGVYEAGTETGDISLQLVGSGTSYGQFRWAGPTTASRGTLNAGQSITPCGAATSTPVTIRFGLNEAVLGEEDGALSVPISLSFAANTTVRIGLGGTAARGSDYTISATTLTFSASGTTQQMVTVTPINDSAEESLETITLFLTNATSGAIGTPSQVVVYVRDDETFTIATANLSAQTAACDSEYDDASQRILRGLKPDILAVQEFVLPAGDTYAAFVERNFGTGFHYFVEVEASNSCAIPNGVISRWPIVASGEWSDPYVGYRDFVWATIDIPGPRNLHLVSVHLDYGEPPDREPEARAITNYIAQMGWPTSDYVVIAGDLNTSTRTDPAVLVLTNIVRDTHQPADQLGNKNTNSNRQKPNDYVLPSPNLDARHRSVVMNSVTFADGLVFDSRVWSASLLPPPIQQNDSGSTGIQHMVVVKRFAVDSSPLPPANVWINEFHYDNIGTDQWEGVEIAGPAGTDLSGYTLYFYKYYGQPYDTNRLTGTIDNETNGFGALWFPQEAIYNGTTSVVANGIALVHEASTTVLQFISYEGILTGSVGAAAGMISEDVGVEESNSTPTNHTIQLAGTGRTYDDFTWIGPTNESRGRLNYWQTISAPSGARAPRSNGQPPTLLPIGNKTAVVGEDLFFGVSAEATGGDPVTLTASNLPPGANFMAVEGNGQFQWVSVGPVGVYTCSFHAVDEDGEDFEIITITITDIALPEDTIVYYDFGADAESFTTAARWASAQVIASDWTSAIGSPVGLSGNPGMAAGQSSWTATNYFAFSITVPAGYELVPLRLIFDDMRIAGGPIVWSLRFSGDNYASVLASESTHTSFDVNSVGFTQIVLGAGTHGFRLFGEGATLPGATWRVDNVLLRGALLEAGRDGDADGLPDAYEIAYFGDVDTADQTSDFDEDGMSDYNEWRAGTNPADFDSVFRVTDNTTGTAAQFILRWPSASNRIYRVERSTNLLIGFEAIETGLPATPPENTYTGALSPSAGSVMFRVGVE